MGERESKRDRARARFLLVCVVSVCVCVCVYTVPIEMKITTIVYQFRFRAWFFRLLLWVGSIVCVVSLQRFLSAATLVLFSFKCLLLLMWS